MRSTWTSSSLTGCGRRSAVDDVTLTKLICAELGRLSGWAWRPNGPTYTAGEVGVFYGPIAAAPDRAVGVRIYAAADERAEHYAWRRVQLRVRGARDRPDGADELAAAAFAALQGLSRVGGISGVSRQSMAPAGADENRREERTENYLIILDNEEALT